MVKAEKKGAYEDKKTVLSIFLNKELFFYFSQSACKNQNYKEPKLIP